MCAEELGQADSTPARGRLLALGAAAWCSAAQCATHPSLAHRLLPDPTPLLLLLLLLLPLAAAAVISVVVGVICVGRRCGAGWVMAEETDGTEQPQPPACAAWHRLFPRAAVPPPPHTHTSVMRSRSPPPHTHKQTPFAGRRALSG